MRYLRPFAVPEELQGLDWFGQDWLWLDTPWSFSVSVYFHGWYLNGPCCDEGTDHGDTCGKCGKTVMFFAHEDLAGFAYDDWETCERVLHAEGMDVLTAALAATEMVEDLRAAKALLLEQNPDH